MFTYEVKIFGMSNMIREERTRALRPGGEAGAAGVHGLVERAQAQLLQRQVVQRQVVVVVQLHRPHQVLLARLVGGLLFDAVVRLLRRHRQRQTR